MDNLLNSADGTIRAARNAGTAFQKLVDGFGRIGIELIYLDNELGVMDETWGASSLINPSS